MAPPSPCGLIPSTRSHLSFFSLPHTPQVSVWVLLGLPPEPASCSQLPPQAPTWGRRPLSLKPRCRAPLTGPPQKRTLDAPVLSPQGSRKGLLNTQIKSSHSAALARGFLFASWISLRSISPTCLSGDVMCSHSALSLSVPRHAVLFGT